MIINVYVMKSWDAHTMPIIGTDLILLFMTVTLAYIQLLEVNPCIHTNGYNLDETGVCK